jgi:hypothetical protein
MAYAHGAHRGTGRPGASGAYVSERHLGHIHVRAGVELEFGGGIEEPDTGASLDYSPTTADHKAVTADRRHLGSH